MGNKKTMLVISEGYPTKKYPQRYSFLKQLVDVFALNGMQIIVICPVYHNHLDYQEAKKWKYLINEREVEVYQPIAFNYSFRTIFDIRLGKVSYLSFKNAVYKTIYDNGIKPDVVYSHFLFPSGCVASELGMKLGVPAFCASGESNIYKSINSVGIDFVRNKTLSLTGIITVSKQNESIIKKERFIRQSEDRVYTHPNSVDLEVFRPLERVAMREKLGLPQDEIIGVFVGAFINRKGVRQVDEASQRAGIKMIYIGTGEQSPNGSNILFSGIVKHERIPEYLCAADFFILPTKEEGCCNAIVEAIACGLPIISTDGVFNDDILDSSFSIRIKAEDVNALERVIRQLKMNESLRKSMSKAALLQRNRFDIIERGKSVIGFIERFM